MFCCVVDSDSHYSLYMVELMNNCTYQKKNNTFVVTWLPGISISFLFKAESTHSFVSLLAKNEKSVLGWWPTKCRTVTLRFRVISTCLWFASYVTVTKQVLPTENGFFRYTRTRPLRPVVFRDNYRLQIVTKRSIFSLVRCIRRYRMSRWSLWSWFGVNQSTFDEDMREKRFLHFRSHQRPWPLTYYPQILLPVTHVLDHVFAKLEVFKAFVFWEYWSHWTDRQTDWLGCNT